VEPQLVSEYSVAGNIPFKLVKSYFFIKGEKRASLEGYEEGRNTSSAYSLLTISFTVRKFITLST